MRGPCRVYIPSFLPSGLWQGREVSLLINGLQCTRTEEAGEEGDRKGNDFSLWTVKNIMQWRLRRGGRRGGRQQRKLLLDMDKGVVVRVSRSFFVLEPCMILKGVLYVSFHILRLCPSLPSPVYHHPEQRCPPHHLERDGSAIPPTIP
jgi:hypothetical protein